jgi:hypothetical protein
VKSSRKKPQLTNPRSAQELLEFYSDFVGYYHQWALRHRTIYWILVYLSVACGIAVAWQMLNANALYVAELALVLNCLLIINSAAKPDRKYPRYRMVEIRLMFELQKMNHGVARRVRDGEEPESALLAAIEELHPKVESLVLEEFGEFFRDFTPIGEFHTQMADVGKRKPPEP